MIKVALVFMFLAGLSMCAIGFIGALLGMETVLTKVFVIPIGFLLLALLAGFFGMISDIINNKI